MPERRFYTWRQPPRLVDRAYAHPGTSSLSIAAVLVGVGLVAFVFTPGQPSAHLLEPLPNWLQIWLGVALVIGGIASTYGLLKTWADLSQGWAWERLGWTLQLGAWGALALLFTALIPATVLTVPHTPPPHRSRRPNHRRGLDPVAICFRGTKHHPDDHPLRVDGVTTDLRGKPGEPGPIGAPGAVATATDYLLVGPGRPDAPESTGGIITGAEPVGCEYRSTDGANVGAWVWRKRLGGWEVVEGDTGLRLVTGWAPEGSTGWLYVQRVGAVVTLVARQLQYPDGPLTLAIPDGFRSRLARLAGSQWDKTQFFPLGVNFSLSPSQQDTELNNGGSAPWTVAAGIRYSGQGTWPTSNPWPTVLPGTPA